MTASLATVRGLLKQQDINVHGQVGEWLIPADCKSAASGYDGSNPSLSTNLRKRGRARFIATVLKTVDLEIGP